jgi:hypothetical protein
MEVKCLVMRKGYRREAGLKEARSKADGRTRAQEKHRPKTGLPDQQNRWFADSPLEEAVRGKFPASWEYTWNFIDFGLGPPNP